MKYLMVALMLGALASALLAVMANYVPGAWWQWLLVAMLLVFAGSFAKYGADNTKGTRQH